jgi:hypothetical protein
MPPPHILGGIGGGASRGELLQFLNVLDQALANELAEEPVCMVLSFGVREPKRKLPEAEAHLLVVVVSLLSGVPGVAGRSDANGPFVVAESRLPFGKPPWTALIFEELVFHSTVDR